MGTLEQRTRELVTYREVLGFGNVNEGGERMLDLVISFELVTANVYFCSREHHRG